MHLKKFTYFLAFADQKQFLHEEGHLRAYQLAGLITSFKTQTIQHMRWNIRRQLTQLLYFSLFQNYRFLPQFVSSLDLPVSHIKTKPELSFSFNSERRSKFPAESSLSAYITAWSVFTREIGLLNSEEIVLCSKPMRFSPPKIH